MKKIITMGCLCICFSARSQEIIKDLFLVNQGISKMETIGILNSKPNVSDITTDSKGTIKFVHNQNLFIGDSENINLLVFENDKLWEQNARVFYKTNEFYICQAKYKEIIAQFDPLKFEIRYYNSIDSKTSEKSGEGVYITKRSDKTWQLNLFYNAEFFKGKLDSYELDVILMKVTK